MKKFILFSLLSAAWLNASAATNQLESLTLDQALELAERQHPQLAEARALVDAASGRAQQAGTLPNPELVVGAQQLPLDSGASNQREYVAGVAQPIPLGGRLGRAREAELLEREVRLRGLESARRDLRKRVHGVFATALYQEQAFRAQEGIVLGYEKSVAATKARVDAGDAVPDELARVEMELARGKMELQRAQGLRTQGRLALASAVGDASLQVKSIEGALDAAFEIPTMESLVANLSSQPELLETEASLRAGEARINLAKAERIPDVKLEALYHRLDGSRQHTFDIGASLPFPVFNRNQGRLREARAEAAAAEARARLTQNEIAVRLAAAYAALNSALTSSRALKTDILPRAEKVLESAEARFRAGDIGLTEVVLVRRDQAAVRLAYLESLRDVMLAWAELGPFMRQLQ